MGFEAVLVMFVPFLGRSSFSFEDTETLLLGCCFDARGVLGN